MKKIEATIRPEKLEAVKDALLEIHIAGMSVSQIMGCGLQHGWSEYVRGSEIMLQMIPKVTITIVTRDERVNEIISCICEAAYTGEVGDGKIFISPVEEVIRIRTGERDADALA